MRPIHALLLFALVATALAGCTHTGSGDTAAIDTSHGCILIELYAEDAPQTVENFIQYAEDGFYEGTIFHRIITGFMIQGGGFTPDGQQKQTRDPVPLEAGLSNERGTIAMARTPDPDSATSQFFINVADNPSLNPSPSSDGYTVFGRVVQGMDVADAIVAEPTGPGPQPGMSDWPVDPPMIEGVRLGGECEDDGGEPPEIIPTEYIPFWVLNTNEVSRTFNISADAPEGWEVTLESDSVQLGPGGDQGDAEANFLSVRNHEPGGIITLNVTSEDGNVSTTMQVRVVDDRSATGARPVPEDAGVLAGLMVDSQGEDRVWEAVLSADVVSAPGDTINLSYTGTFDDGEEFDSGSFSTTVRSGQTVPGFDTGLLGIAQGETVQLRFPPDLGYGYNPPAHMQQFAGKWLNFEVTADSIG